MKCSLLNWPVCFIEGGMPYWLYAEEQKHSVKGCLSSPEIWGSGGGRHRIGCKCLSTWEAEKGSGKKISKIFKHIKYRMRDRQIWEQKKYAHLETFLHTSGIRGFPGRKGTPIRVCCLHSLPHVVYWRTAAYSIQLNALDTEMCSFDNLLNIYNFHGKFPLALPEEYLEMSKKSQSHPVSCAYNC